jgi:hypothetical protein
MVGLFIAPRPFHLLHLSRICASVRPGVLSHRGPRRTQSQGCRGPRPTAGQATDTRLCCGLQTSRGSPARTPHTFRVSRSLPHWWDCLFAWMNPPTLVCPPLKYWSSPHYCRARPALHAPWCGVVCPALPCLLCLALVCCAVLSACRAAVWVARLPACQKGRCVSVCRVLLCPACGVRSLDQERGSTPFCG